MLERILIFVVFCTVCYGAYQALQRWQIRRISKIDPLLAGLRLDIPTIVYFTTPLCHVCKFQQTPVLEQLQREAAVQVIRVDAAEQPDAAERWGVLTAPTTFILDQRGLPRAVNNGVADERTLCQQLGLAC